MTMIGDWLFTTPSSWAAMTTVLRKMVGNCEFQDLKYSLILDRIVLGVTDNHTRVGLLRVPDLP